VPSNKSPSVLNPGPGRLSANQVPASALSFPITGGDLSAHINDLTDAHMAGAIGVPETNPTTGQPLLSSAGGPYDGESTMDALTLLSDLFPVRPDRLGFDGGVANSGLPNWSAALTVGGNALRGAFTKSGASVVTKYLTPVGSVGTHTVTGNLYPADRGVLALYSTTNGDFFNSAQTTLLGALWLGPNPAPSGLAGSAFVESTRTTGQSDYTASNVGLDIISLIDRLPYLSNYPGSEYTPFGSNFSGYQLAKYSFPVTLVSGDSASRLLVHWKEGYANSLAAIQPAALTALTLVAANCYSAVPAQASEFDTVVRRNIYVDAQSGSSPSGVTLTSSPAGTVTTSPLSGINYYNSTGFQVNLLSTVNNLFQNSYLTNSVASVSVPAGFTSSDPIAEVLMGEFGGVTTPYQLFDASPARVVNDAGGAPFSLVSPPALGSVARFVHATHPTATAPAEPTFPYSRPTIRWKGAFAGDLDTLTTERYLFNTGFSGFDSTTLEPFCSETYRYVGSYAASTASAPMLPAGGDDYNSTVSLPAGELQVQAGRLVYPSENFTSAVYYPANAGRNYATILAGDALNTKRRYIRAFDTGIARNTGRLRITGVAFADFEAGVSVDPGEITDHTGGMVVQIKVPGATGWLDLGRDSGAPDLDKSQDFRGCLTGASGDVYSFDTGSFTSDNGSGVFLLFVRVTLIKNGVGQTLNVQEIEWLPPV
jgi:hypothetical protein